jgi:hypothetical protein
MSTKRCTWQRPERIRISEIAKRKPITGTVDATLAEAATHILAEHVMHLPRAQW